MGVSLGCGGHLVALRRTAVGPFEESDAVVVDGDTTPEDVTVLPIADVARRCFPTLDLDPVRAERVRHGGRLPDVTLERLTALFENGEFLALYQDREGIAAPVAVFV